MRRPFSGRHACHPAVAVRAPPIAGLGSPQSHRPPARPQTSRFRLRVGFLRAMLVLLNLVNPAFVAARSFATSRAGPPMAETTKVFSWIVVAIHVLIAVIVELWWMLHKIFVSIGYGMSRYCTRCHNIRCICGRCERCGSKRLSIVRCPVCGNPPSRTLEGPSGDRGTAFPGQATPGPDWDGGPSGGIGSGPIP
jgi:hypothetical protein